MDVLTPDAGRTSQQQIPSKSQTFGGDAGESPHVKIQRVDAIVEPVEVGATATTGPTTEAPLVVGSAGGGLRTTPSLVKGGDQSHGEIGGLSDLSHHPSYQRKGWKRVQAQVVPRMTKRILEDRLGIRDKGTV